MQTFRLPIGVVGNEYPKEGINALPDLARNYARVILDCPYDNLAGADKDNADIQVIITYYIGEDNRRKQKSFYFVDWLT
jgi:hypothetical protein